jgi:CelD/BcsL family acetyltransferase involved in cellulose biosynthesis
VPDRQLVFRSTEDSLVAMAGYSFPQVGPILEPIESHWLFGCPLLGAAPVALLDAILREELFRGRRPTVVLSGILAHGALWKSVATTFEKDYEIRLARPTIFRTASLEGGVDGYLSRRSGNHRHKLRHAVKRASEVGITFQRHSPATAEATEFVYDRILAVEALSWKGIGQCGMAEPPSRDFYRFLLRRLSASAAGRVIFARQEGRDVGFVFGGVTGTHYRGQQFSYAQECSHWSIGNLLQFEQIQWLCEEGFEWYDMGPLMDYKVHWAEIGSRTDTLLLRARW